MEMSDSDKALAKIDKLVFQDESEKCRKEYEGLREKIGELREAERELSDRLKRKEERYARFVEEQSEITVSRDKLISKLNENVRLVKRFRDSILLGSVNELAEVEMSKLQSKLKRSREKCRNLKNEVERLREDERMSSERYAKASEEVEKTKAEVQDLKGQNLAAGQIIEELRRRQVDVDRRQNELNLEYSKIMEKFRRQVLAAKLDIINSGERMEDMNRRLSRADQIVDGLRCQNSEASNAVNELRDRLNLEKVRYDQVIQEMSIKQLEADQIVKEHRRESMEASNVIEDLKNQLCVAASDKSRYDELIKEMRQKQLEADQTVKELRCQSMETSNVIQELKNRVLAAELGKLRSDETIQEMSQKQIKADKIVEGLKLKISEAFRCTIEDLKSTENLEASKKSKGAHFQDSRGGTQEQGDGNLQGIATGYVGVVTSVMSQKCSTFDASRLQKTGSNNSPPELSNYNAERSHQACAASCYNHRSKSNSKYQERDSKKLLGSASDPIDVDDDSHNEACRVQRANNSDSSTNFSFQAKIFELPSPSRSLLPISSTPRRKRHPLEREDGNSTNCRQSNKRIRMPTHEAHAISRDDKPGSPSSWFKGMGNNPVLKNCEKKAFTPYASLPGNFNSSDEDGSSTDSEDESCTESCIKTIIASLRSKKLRKEWISGSHMLDHFQQDIELCMNSVCALYRQKVSNTESSIDSHRRFAHFDAMGGPNMAEYLINGDAKNRMKKSVAEVKQERPDVVDQCRRLAVDYCNELFSIYCSGKDAFFKPT